MSENSPAITNIKVFPVSGSKTVKGNVYFTVGGTVTVKGTVLAGKTGDFVSLPGRKYKAADGTEKWADDVKFVNRQVSEAAQKLILAEYNKVVKTGGAPTGKTSTGAKTKGDEIPF